MATTRLKIYNGALLLAGEGQLHSTTGLTENREPRYLLDLFWNDGGVRYCLEQGQWHFARRSSRFSYEPAIAPDWGFRRAFAKPSDWVNTNGVFQDERFTTPCLQYADEVGYWFADLDEIFVSYVSDHEAYGGDLSRWPATFTEYVKAEFAARIIRKLPGGKDKVDDVEKERDKRLLLAKNKAAMALPATFPTRGTWAASRWGTRGRRGPMGDGGSTGQLIG